MKRWKNADALAVLIAGSTLSLMVSACQRSAIIGWCYGTLTAWTLAVRFMFRNGR